LPVDPAASSFDPSLKKCCVRKFHAGIYTRIFPTVNMFCKKFQKIFAITRKLSDNGVMGNRAADQATIGRNLNEARQRAGLTVEDLVTKAGIHLSSWYRLVNGESEGGCRTVTELSLFCGTTPNPILLEADGDHALTSEDRVALDQIAGHLARVNARRQNWPRRPAAIVADLVRDVVAQLPSEEAEAQPLAQAAVLRIPLGTVIAKPEASVTTYKPPPRVKKTKAKKARIA
jgi:transcriptional regulator with XRE-family HTH domain